MNPSELIAPSRSDDPLALAAAIAQDPTAQTSFVGTKPVGQRSLWSLMSGKLKALLVGAAVAGVATLAPPGMIHSLLSYPSDLLQSFQNTDRSQSLSTSSHQQVHTNGFKAAVGPLLVSKPMVQPTVKGLLPAAVVTQVQNAEPPKSPAPITPIVTAPTIESLTQKIDKALPNGGVGMSSGEMAIRMLEIDPFMSLATAVENVVQTVYYDPGGTNIGMGYCVTKRVAEYGKERVKNDLMHAGLTSEDAVVLMGNHRAAHKKIRLTPAGTLRLLEITKPDYQRLAEEAFGKEAFDKLPRARQAALTYIAYNTGNVMQFSTLLKATHRGDHVTAMQNLAMHWKDRDGVKHTNDRSRAWLQATWLGEDHLAAALSNPSAFESDVGIPDREALLASLAKPGAARDKLLARRASQSAWTAKALLREREKDPLKEASLAPHRKPS